MNDSLRYLIHGHDLSVKMLYTTLLYSNSHPHTTWIDNFAQTEALKIRQLRLPESEKVAVTHEKIGSLARGMGKAKKAQIAFEGNHCNRKLNFGDFIVQTIKQLTKIRCPLLYLYLISFSMVLLTPSSAIF